MPFVPPRATLVPSTAASTRARRPSRCRRPARSASTPPTSS